MRYLRTLGVVFFNHLQNIGIYLIALSINKELSHRDAERGRNGLRWLTPDEAVVAEALANVIVPSDGETPGLDEVCVLGPPAVVALDNLVAISSYRQYLYARGLLSFDRWALKERGCKFAEMPKEDQIMLFRAAQQVSENWSVKASAVTKVWGRLRAITQGKCGSFFAAQLYPQIRNDCLQVFYTSRVSWVWLEYDGPPMDKGYPSLVEPR
jgi:hypothetical protein